MYICKTKVSEPRVALKWIKCSEVDSKSIKTKERDRKQSVWSRPKQKQTKAVNSLKLKWKVSENKRKWFVKAYEYQLSKHV